jgi:hypothetical protein
MRYVTTYLRISGITPIRTYVPGDRRSYGQVVEAAKEEVVEDDDIPF